MYVGRLQGFQHGVELNDVAGEARAHPRWKICFCLYSQRMQDEVQLTGSIDLTRISMMAVKNDVL